MKKILAVLSAVASIALFTQEIVSAAVYLSDGSIIVKVEDETKVAGHLRDAGWKDVPAVGTYAAHVQEYGPEDDSAVTTKGVLIYPMSEDPAVRQDRSYCTKWYSYELEGYAKKVVTRLVNLSSFLKKKAAVDSYRELSKPIMEVEVSPRSEVDSYHELSKPIMEVEVSPRSEADSYHELSKPIMEVR